MEEDYELTLIDRLEMIRTTLKDVPDSEIYLSYSGGKDSTVLHYLLDEALPGNQIERVFSNTGIEYISIVNFVKSLAETDSRFRIISPGKNIKEMLEEVGYPFKSKVHSEMLERYQQSGTEGISVQKYLDRDGKGINSNVQKCLLYQFEPEFDMKNISEVL